MRVEKHADADSAVRRLHRPGLVRRGHQVAGLQDRFKDFSDKMRTGNIFSVAEILKNLTYLSQLKPLSFREKRMLERARFLVVSELAIASKRAELQIGEVVDMALRKACMKHDRKLARPLVAKLTAN